MGGSESFEATQSVQPIPAPFQVEVSDACFLNNFHCTMPGGFYRHPIVLSAVFSQGETFLEAMRRIAAENGETLSAQEIEGYSVLKLSESPEKFFQTIDNALAAGKVELVQLEQQVRRLEAPDMLLSERSRIIRDIHAQLLPIYMSLRIHGYSHRDLTA